MQAVEALTRLIEMADAAQSSDRIDIEAGKSQMDDESLGEFKQDEAAIAICQAMLNTAIPVARFRVFVQIESGREKGREYTICGVRIEDIVTALYPISKIHRDIYVTLWEQRPTGADMLEGFQGKSNASPGKPFHAYLEGLRKYAEVAN